MSLSVGIVFSDTIGEVPFSVSLCCGMYIHMHNYVHITVDMSCILILSTYISDIDECYDGDYGSNGGCDHSCVNTAGSYHCICNNGYDLVNTATCIGEFNYIYMHVRTSVTKATD